MNRCPRTHGARFNCSKQIAVDQAVITDVSSGFAQCDDFGMRRGIVVGQVTVPAASNHALVADYDGPDGNFSGLERPLCAAQELFHPKLVSLIFVARKQNSVPY